jgi:hypothetical protein
MPFVACFIAEASYENWITFGKIFACSYPVLAVMTYPGHKVAYKEDMKTQYKIAKKQEKELIAWAESLQPITHSEEHHETTQDSSNLLLTFTVKN